MAGYNIWVLWVLKKAMELFKCDVCNFVTIFWVLLVLKTRPVKGDLGSRSKAERSRS